MRSINRNYFFITVLLLLLEIAIAQFFKDYFIRGFLGDVVVIPLLYYFIRFFLQKNIKRLKEYIVLVAFCVEFIQYSKIIEQFTIHSSLLKIVLGSTFDTWDLLAYCLGYILIKKHSTL